MISRKEIKDLAKKQIEGNLGALFLCYLIVMLIVGASSFTFIGPIVLAPVFTLSFSMIHLNLVKGKVPEIANIFDGFKEKGFENSIILWLLIYVYTFLWSLLFIIPGIIKGLSYSMSYYILIDNPQMTPMEALKESQRITYGHKWELFVLQLSFILWNLLIPLTFGLISIYLAPYMQMTNVNFYNKIKNIKEKE